MVFCRSKIQLFFGIRKGSKLSPNIPIKNLGKIYFNIRIQFRSRGGSEKLAHYSLCSRKIILRMNSLWQLKVDYFSWYRVLVVNTKTFWTLDWKHFKYAPNGRRQTSMKKQLKIKLTFASYKYVGVRLN